MPNKHRYTYKRSGRWLAGLSVTAAGAFGLSMSADRSHASEAWDPGAPLTIENATSMNLTLDHYMDSYGFKTGADHHLAPGRSTVVDPGTAGRRWFGDNGNVALVMFQAREGVFEKGEFYWSRDDGAWCGEQKTDPLKCEVVKNGKGIPTGFRITSTEAAPRPEIVMAAPELADAGEALKYTVTVRNPGPKELLKSDLALAVPQGMTYVTGSSTFNGKRVQDGDGPEIKISSGAIPANGTAVYGFSLKTADNARAGTRYEPVATLNLSALYTADWSVSPSASSVIAATNLQLTGDFSGKHFSPGERASYTLKVTNNGEQRANAVAVETELPAEFKAVTFATAPAKGSCAPVKDRRSTCDLGTLEPGATATVTVNATVTDATPQTITAKGQVRSRTHELDPGDDTATLTATTSADVSVGVAGPGTGKVTAGDTMTYTFTASNDGPSSAVNTAVAVTFPEGFKPTASSTGHGTYGDDRIWKVGRIPSGQTVALTVTGTVPGDVDELKAAARVTSAWESNPDNDAAETTTAVVQRADLGTTVQADHPKRTAGEPLAYTFKVANKGASTAREVEATLSLPPGMVMEDPLHGTYDPDSGVWTLGDVGPGRTVVLKATGPAPGDVDTAVATAEVRTSTPNADPGDASRAEVAVEHLADALVTVATDRDELTAGEAVTYTVTAKNQGPSTARDMQVEANVPEGFMIAGVDVGFYDPATGIWSVGDLEAGGSVALRLAEATPADQEMVSADVKVSSTTHDPVPENDKHHTDASVSQSADLALGMTVDWKNPEAGGRLIFTVRGVNNGPSTAKNVEVTDHLPKGFTLANAYTDAGRFDAKTGKWTVGDVPVGEEFVLTLEGTAPYAGGADIVNRAEITRSDTPDPSGDNTYAEASALVKDVADLNVETAISQVRPTVGDEVTLTATLSNKGPETARNVRLHDRLPSGLKYVSDDSGGTYDPKTGVWKTADIPAGESRKLTMKVIAAHSGEVTNEITYAASDNYDPTPCLGGCAKVTADIRPPLSEKQAADELGPLGRFITGDGIGPVIAAGGISAGLLAAGAATGYLLRRRRP
ncbi:hypothetical protein ACIQWN_37295 [Streptomyces vinaceus]|uniref:COG1361 S-layer family protein n=1 Tax=Streptomyces vinaceus TaxID=1960 RepID=UPI0038038389